MDHVSRPEEYDMQEAKDEEKEHSSGQKPTVLNAFFWPGYGLHGNAQTKEQGENREELGVKEQLEYPFCQMIDPGGPLFCEFILVEKGRIHDHNIDHKDAKNGKSAIHIKKFDTLLGGGGWLRQGEDG